MTSKPSVEQIKALQRKLNAAGLWDADGKPLRVDGSLGEKTQAAIDRALSAAPRVTTRSSRALVAAVQSALKASGITDDKGGELSVDGQLGPLTRSAIAKVNPAPGIMGEARAVQDVQPQAVAPGIMGVEAPGQPVAAAGPEGQPTAHGEFIPQSLQYDSRMYGQDPFQASASGAVGQGSHASADGGNIQPIFPEGSEVAAHPVDRLRLAAAMNPNIEREIGFAAMRKAKTLAQEKNKNAWWNRSPVGAGYVTPFGSKSPELASMKASPPQGVDALLAKLLAR